MVGLSTAYHLGAMGASEVLLLERHQLTSGTSWHAAGIIGPLRATLNMTQLASYAPHLFRKLEAETGQSTGYQQTGGLWLTTAQERMAELHRIAAMGLHMGMHVEMLSPQEVERHLPCARTDDLAGGFWLEEDGQANPVDVCMTYAKAARQHGVTLRENAEVTNVQRTKSGFRILLGDGSAVDCAVLINCAGAWAPNLGRMLGAPAANQPVQHMYVVTEPLDSAPNPFPVTRDLEFGIYLMGRGGSLVLGGFEPDAKVLDSRDPVIAQPFVELPEDWEQFEPFMNAGLNRLPDLEHAGIQHFMNGPESFTPDVRYHLGEAPELRNCYVAAGFNSIGLHSAGGAGMVMAEWIRDRRPPVDLWEVDVRRDLPFQSNRRYLQERVSESLGLLYAMHWPFHQKETSRGVRCSPVHDRLVEQGACHGVAFGWERPNWYAEPGSKPKYEYSYGRQNWFEPSAEEHRAVREGVGLLDQSSFAKFRLQGRDAERVLNQICANDVAMEPGRLVYTQWLNEAGGIEADLTVTRLALDDYLIVTSGEFQVRDFDWLKRHIPEDAHVVATDVTSGLAIISIMGPRARDLLSRLTPDDLSNEAFPFAASRQIELGYSLVRASRITYVGELGWEIYIPSEFTLGVYDLLVETGADFSLRHAGMHAMNSLRIEKAYRHYGHDITDDDTPLEAGLGFAVKLDKPGGFNGRNALLKQKEIGVSKRLVQFLLENPEPLLYHNEPIWRDGALAGYVRSGMYGHTLGGAVGLGYIEHENGVDVDYVMSGTYEIEVAGELYSAKPSLQPLYDPCSERVKA